MTKYICFDLEGPLSPQDNAYELMKLFPNGDKVFEVISRYDDLLALEKREGYEPGDTLSLIVPFLVLHDISESEIATLAAKATLTGGAAELISQLQFSSWKVFCISTSYQQYARYITQKLGIYAHNVASTPFSLDRFRSILCKEDTELLKQGEEEILKVYPLSDNEQDKKRLDDFFWKRLPSTEIGQAIREVKPVGGQRKVIALNKFAETSAQPLSQWVVIGDSITDASMLQAVDEAGGLAIAFNANEYALPYATMSLASTSISDLLKILQVWPQNQRKGVEALVKERERTGGADDRGHFHWLSGRKDRAGVLEIHRRIRRLVREEAGKLG